MLLNVSSLFFLLSSVPFHENPTIYPFSWLWTFELFTVWGYYKVIMNIHSYCARCRHVSISLRK